MQQRPNPRGFSFKTVLLCCLLIAGSSLLRAERLPIKIYTSADGLGAAQPSAWCVTRGVLSGFALVMG